MLRTHRILAVDVNDAGCYIKAEVERGAKVYWMRRGWGREECDKNLLYDLYKVDGRYILTGGGGEPLFEGESPEADKEIRRFRRMKAGNCPEDIRRMKSKKYLKELQW
jgi:hypothetical protein